MKKEKLPENCRFEEESSIPGINIVVHMFDECGEHMHDYYEFEYVLEGEGICIINNKAHTFNEGYLSFASPTDLHSYRGTTTLKTITVSFDLSSVSTNLSDITAIKACTMKCTEEMRLLFNLLAKEKRAKKYRSIICHNLLESILIMFLRTQNIQESSALPTGIMHAIGYISKNFKSNINLSEVSEKSGYSNEHFCRQFKKYTGMSFIEYLTDLRVSHARNLLMNRDANIPQICHQCGFGSTRSLHRAFLKKFGCSPIEYKKAIKNEENETTPINFF